jgi:hypothetical protein
MLSADCFCSQVWPRRLIFRSAHDSTPEAGRDADPPFWPARTRSPEENFASFSQNSFAKQSTIYRIGHSRISDDPNPNLF